MKIGVDLGGTKIEVAVLDGYEILFRERTPTPQGDYSGTLKAITELIQKAQKQTQTKGPIGIATPGTLTNKGVLKNSNSTCLIGKPLKRDLEEILKQEIRMANDANCFALSEACWGAGKDADSVFGVILGTGVGGGLIIQKSVCAGMNGIAGEWGHNPLPWPEPEELPGPPCYCGLHGCIETFLSGPGLSKAYSKKTGRNRTAEQIHEDAKNYDLEADQLLKKYEHQLARSLAMVINIFDPECIVLGGGLSHFSRFYKNVPKIWETFVFSDEVKTKILPPQNGDSSGVLGAASLW